MLQGNIADGFSFAGRDISAYQRLDHLEVVLKVSERCNLKCSYCYFFFAGDDSWQKHPVSIALNTVEQVAVYSQNMALTHCLPEIILTLHGGEPLLLKKEHFRKICQTFREHETPAFRFRFFLQTNAVLIDEEWIELFSEFDIAVGISLDGAKEVNDLHRIDTHGHSSYDETVAGLRQLQAAAQQGRINYPALICVVNPQADGAKTYRHFVDDLNIKSISFRVPVYTHDRAPAPGIIADTNRFMLEALGQWFEDDNPSIAVHPFMRYFDSMLLGQVADSSGEFGEDYRNIISISSNGDVGPEDCVRTVHPRFADIGLNVSNSSFDDLGSTSAWKEMYEAAATPPKPCQTCIWWKICKGGPLVTRFSNASGFNNPSIYCDGLKQMYAMIADALVRTGIPRKEIMDRLLHPNASNTEKVLNHV